MKKIHTEFAYQSRELGIQIEDTLGDPPNRKNYDKVIKSLIDEFAHGSEIDDVNLLSFALVDHLKFHDPAALLAQCNQYSKDDALNIFHLISCNDAMAAQALAMVVNSNPALARQAILTAFLFKHPKRWSDDDISLDELAKSEVSDNEEDDAQVTPEQDVERLFDSNGDNNAR
ncbi:MAG: hypothetical protein R8K48_02930 [Gallionella sp.]